MSQEVNLKQKERIKTASENLEEMLRRIEPFLKKPTEEPIEHKPWVISDPNRMQQSSQTTRKNTSN